MTQTARAVAGAAGFALGTLGLFVPVAVAETATARGKAQIEHDERSAAEPTIASKAQVEHAEREQALSGSSQARPASGQERSPALTPERSVEGDAAAWQLALSAALGAVVTGGVVLLSRQVSPHRQAVTQ